MIFQNSVTGGGGGGNAYAELSFHVIPLSFKNDFDIKKIQLQNIFIFFENSCGWLCFLLWKVELNASQDIFKVISVLPINL